MGTQPHQWTKSRGSADAAKTLHQAFIRFRLPTRPWCLFSMSDEHSCRAMSLSKKSTLSALHAALAGEKKKKKKKKKKKHYSRCTSAHTSLVRQFGKRASW